MASGQVEKALKILEAFNKRDYSDHDHIFAEDVTWKDHSLHNIDNPVMPNQGHPLGKEEIQEWWQTWAEAFPDGRIDVEETHEDGNFVIIQGVGKGKNTGAFGPFEGKGEYVELPFCAVHKFNDDGKIVEAHYYSDLLTVLVHGGHMPHPKAAFAGGGPS